MEDQTFRDLYFKLRDKIDNLMETFEERLEEHCEEIYDSPKETRAEFIVKYRLLLFTYLLERFCGWKSKADCIPDYVRIGRNHYLEIKLKEN